jgi:hypothetical protein
VALTSETSRTSASAIVTSDFTSASSRTSRAAAA